MAVFYGTVSSGFSVSSAFTLRASDKVLMIGVSSAATTLWYASFQVSQGGPFLRYFDPWAASASAFAGVGGGWGAVAYPPSDQVRIEVAAPVTSTISFALVEVTR